MKLVTVVAIMSIIGLSFLAAAFGLTVMPDVEGLVRPVVASILMDEPDQVGRVLTFKQTIDKKRDCSVANIRYQVSRENTGYIDVVVLNEYGAPAGTITRPLGEYQYGPFKSMLPFGFDFQSMRMRAVVLYSCHALWNTKQTIQLIP